MNHARRTRNRALPPGNRRFAASSVAFAGMLMGLVACGATPSPRAHQDGTPAKGAGSASLMTQAQARYEAGGAEHPEDVHIGADSAKARIAYGPPGSFRAEATARAAYGTLRGTAVASGQETLYPSQGCRAEATFRDTLTLMGAEGMGTVVYTFTLTGFASGPGNGAYVFVHHGTDPDEELGEDVTVSGEFKSLPHVVTFGTAFEFRATLMCQGRFEQGQSGESACRFTAELSAVEVFDSEGRGLRGIRGLSASGTTYPIVGARNGR